MALPVLRDLVFSCSAKFCCDIWLIMPKRIYKPANHTYIKQGEIFRSLRELMTYHVNFILSCVVKRTGEPHACQSSRMVTLAHFRQEPPMQILFLPLEGPVNCKSTKRTFKIDTSLFINV